MNIKIRKVLPGDCTQLSILAIASKAYWGYDKAFMDRCVEELTIKEEAAALLPTYTVVVNHELAGFYQLEPIDAVRIELNLMFIRPDFIGKGLGKKLLEHAKKMALETGFQSVVIQSDPNAVGFYCKNGAKAIGYRASESIPGRTLPLLRIDIPPSPKAPKESLRQ